MSRLLPPSPSPKPRRLVSNLLKGIGLGVGVTAIAGTAGGLWWGWNFVQSDLAPTVQKDLQKRINRPLEMGNLESISWGKIKFGASTLPAYSRQVNGQTIRDRDSATVESVEVTFNPLQALMTREVDLHLIVNRPKVFLDEAPDEDWLDLNITEPKGDSFLKTQVKTIKLRNGTVRLDPSRTNQRTLTQVNAELQIKSNEQRIDLSGSSQIDSGGSLAFKGKVLTQTRSLKLETKAQNLYVPPLVGLLPTDLPFAVKNAKLNGDINLYHRPNQPLKVDSNITAKGLDVDVPSENVKIKAQQFKGKIQLDVQPGSPVELRGEGQIFKGTGSVPEDLILSTGRSRRRVIQNVNGNIKFLGQKQRFWSDLTGVLVEGGDLKLSGVTSFLEQRSNLNIRVQNVPAPLLDKAFNLPINVRSGSLSGNLNLKLNKGDRPSVNGITQVQNVEMQISGLPQSFTNTTGYLRFKGLTTTFDTLSGNYGSIPLVVNGSIDPDKGYDLRGQSKPVEVNRGLGTLGLTELPFPVAGEVIAKNLTVTGLIEKPILQGSVKAYTPLTLDKVPVQQVSAQFRLEQPLLKISQIEATPDSGGIVTGSARYNLQGTEPWIAAFEAEQILGNAFAGYYDADPGFNLGPVASQIGLEVLGDRYQIEMDLQAPEGEFPATGRLRATSNGVELQAIDAKIPGGELLTSGTVVDGQVALTTKIPGINLVEYSEELRGQLTGELEIQSPLAGFSSETAIAQGQVQFTQGISLIEDPITAQVRWDGKQINIPKATAPGFFAQGSMGAILQGEEAPQLTTLDLAIRQQNYDLASLPFEFPANSKLSGLADLQGQLFGQVYSPSLKSTVQARNVVINDLPFEPLLTGSLTYDAAKGLDIKTRGKSDRIILALNANQEPTSFVFQNQDGLATGKTVANNQLAVKVKQVPLTALNWDVVNDYGYGQVSGIASGEFQVALPTYDIKGPLTISQPAIGPFQGDRLAGQFQVQNGIIAIQDSELTRNNNRFQINAQLIPDLDPKFSGNITIANAQVEDAIATLNTLDFIAPQTNKTPDYGEAKTLETIPVGQPQAPLLFQLQRLAEINKLRLDQQELEAKLAQIPSWTELTGSVQGQVSFNGSTQTGINADFELASAQVDWASIPFQNVALQGFYRKDELALSRLSLDSNGGNIAFQGRLGPQNDGKLTITQLPLGELSFLFAPTLPIEGFLNAEASLDGSFGNPSVTGQVELSNATINQSQIRTAAAQFDYQQARLKLEGYVDINNPDPVRFEGNIPYAFPFMDVAPASNALEVKLQAKNAGLALLNLFTDQISWVDGAGEIDISVLGTLTRPNLLGRAVIQNATIDSLSLPAPLTQVSGELNFNQEQVQVNNLQGSFSEGKLFASGTLPIFSQELQNKGNETSSQNTLQVDLDDLALDVRGLYKGGVNGKLKISGSLLSPNIGGMVALNQGQIILSDATAFSGQTTSETLPAPPSPTVDKNQPLQFNNLTVQLKDQVRILQPPLLNFSTQGQLVVNGSIDSPRPEGKVTFTKGDVNLFTSFFRINRQEQNYAEFSPSNGLDPYLNINLTTTLSDVNAGRNERLNEFEDPLAGTLGSIESVRVNAKVDGRASQLISNLQQSIELTSKPNRSEGELLALLSGGVPEAIQGGNTDLALANIASSAVLNRFQSYVDDAFSGRATFRLFPVLIPNEADRSVLAFGGEVGYDVTNDLSVSVLQVLTGSDDPTLFNISYDINERLRSSGSISIDGEATALLEYRFRF